MEVEINDAELRGEREGAGHEQRWIRGEKKESRENYIKKREKAEAGATIIVPGRM